eukprot:379786-Lingulodinium_polyedra.AAC.1
MHSTRCDFSQLPLLLAWITDSTRIAHTSIAWLSLSCEIASVTVAKNGQPPRGPWPRTAGAVAADAL